MYVNIMYIRIMRICMCIYVRIFVDLHTLYILCVCVCVYITLFTKIRKVLTTITYCGIF